VNVLGAYDAVSHELIKIVNRTYITSGTVIELMEKVRAMNPSVLLTMVMDNTRYQRCQAVMDRASELGIDLMYLPTYSPNLNLIERIWKYVKRKCLYSKYHKTAKEFEEAIVECLGTVNGQNDEIKKLMTLKFQMFPKDQTQEAAMKKLA